MATSKRTTAKKTTSATAKKRQTTIKDLPVENSFLRFLKDTTLGRFVLGVSVFFLLVGIDLLFSLNNFDKFFLLFGIELTVFVLLCWVIFVIRNKKKQE